MLKWLPPKKNNSKGHHKVKPVSKLPPKTILEIAIFESKLILSDIRSSLSANLFSFFGSHM